MLRALHVCTELVLVDSIKPVSLIRSHNLYRTQLVSNTYIVQSVQYAGMSPGRLDLGTPDLKTSRDQTPYTTVQIPLSF